MRKKPLITLICLAAISVTLIVGKIKGDGATLDNFQSLKTVQSDVDSLMAIYSAKTGDKTAYNFKCRIDENLKGKSFAYSIKGGNILFTGEDEISASHAVYTFLGELGFIFNLDGINTSEKLVNVADIAQDTLITPKVKLRGIRQHVNFPMDISSYSLPDAKKYVDDLVRLRFNKLTIHSYPGQWYESQVADTTMYAGHFFYGNEHFMHNNELLQVAVPENDTLYCIPEAEKVRHNAKNLSNFAMNWMQELIKYAKEKGLYVQFSFETRTDSPEKALDDIKSVYNTYPMVDALELITEETGGWGKRCVRSEVEATLKKYFSPEIASNEQVNSPIKDKQSDLNYLYTQIGVHAEAVKRINEQKLYPNVEMKVGIYCSIYDYLCGAYRLARLASPDTKVCMLPSHGSDGTAHALPYFLTDKEDMKQTELYSWVEFDGLMYLQQNSIQGNQDVFNELDKVDGGESLVTSILYNHWRTTENKASARYVAEATIKEKSPEEFYASYAAELGIKDAAKYEKAMKIINTVDSFSKGGLGNIGFCWMGAWRTGGSFMRVSTENIEKARAMHLEAGELVAELIKDSKEGSNAYNYLKFLGNRLLCTIQYLDAFKYAASIRDIKKNSKGEVVSKAEQNKAVEICNHALLMFDEYMATHSKMMPDRGCKGTLVSVWNAPIRGLKIFRSQLGGVALEELPTSEKAVDAPPLPIFFEE